MGYNKSRTSVIRNRQQLEQLLKAKESLVFSSKDPHNLAAKLREAIAAACEIEEFKEFAPLKQMYKFKVQHDSVLAEFIEPPSEGVPAGKKEEVTQTSEPSAPPEPPKPPEKKTLPNAETLQDVLLFAMKFPEDEELHFPEALLGEGDKYKLSQWVKENDWKFIDHEEGGLTLTKKDVPVEVLWAG